MNAHQKKALLRLKNKCRDQMDFRSSLNGYIIKKLTLYEHFIQYSFGSPKILPNIKCRNLRDAISAQLHLDCSKEDQVPFLYIQKPHKHFAFQLNIDTTFYQYFYHNSLAINLSIINGKVALSHYLNFTHDFISIPYNLYTNIRDGMSGISPSASFETLSFDHIYKKIKDKKFTKYNKLNNKDIIPILRPYQKDAVNWMIYKEMLEQNLVLELNPKEFLKLKTHSIWYYPTLECVSLRHINNVSHFPGGILSDEMGLGKTVELLSLIVNHQMEDWKFQKLIEDDFKFKSNIDDCKKRNKNNNYRINKSVNCTCGKANKKIPTIVCPSCLVEQHKECIGLSEEIKTFLCPNCWKFQDLLPSKATLIVVPESLFTQWNNEISNHLEKGKYSIFLYRGFEYHRYVQPTFLMKHLIVLTTYEAFSKDLKYSCVQTDNTRLRQPKKYLQPSTPLTNVKWWRICLDEGQKVSTQCQSAIMAAKLTSVHRWTVTGTPFQKKASDICGLLKFLKLDPEFTNNEFYHLFTETFDHGYINPIANLLRNIMWRNSKEDVKDQINLPSIHNQIIFIDLNTIEQHIYYTQLEKVQQELTNFLNSLESFRNLKLSYADALDSDIREQVLKILHPLILVCTLPSMKNPVSSLEELTDSMIKSSKLKAEQHLRAYITSLNGAAALHILNQSNANAMKIYLKALEISNNFKDQFKTDLFQIIHIKHNLGELLNRPYEKDPEINRKGNQYLIEVENHEEQFLSKSKSSIDLARKNLQLVQNIISKNISDKTMWWAQALGFALEKKVPLFDDEYLLPYIRNGLDFHNNGEKNPKRIKFQNISSSAKLLKHLDKWFSQIINHREQINSDLENLEHEKSLPQKALDCHLKKSEGEPSGPKCSICKIEENLKLYERLLFAIYKKKLKNFHEEEQSDKGTWKASESEIILKLLLNYIKNKIEPDIITKANIFFKELENYKREFKNLRHVWSLISQHVSSQDELRMCKSRLDLTSLSITEDYQLSVILNNTEAEAQEELQKFNKSSSRYKYFKNIKTNNVPEPCHICSSSLQFEWDFLSCGHSFCHECIINLKKNLTNSNALRCPYCREQTLFNQIYRVLLTQEHKNVFSKIEATLNLVKKLIDKDSEVKIIIFSERENILDFLEKKLTEKDIIHVRFKAALKFQKNLDIFKAHGSPISVLLMSTRSGSKGLNLTEASHLIFLEPLLNPADESQAIGRIYRMGQTRETYIHRFIAKRTIEEKISLLTSNQRIKCCLNDVLSMLYE